jgi:hypothetical protein
MIGQFMFQFVFYIFAGVVPFFAVADDCDLIRSRLAALPATGGSVSIPAGHYICQTPIVLNRSHVELRGHGHVNLGLTPHANAPMIIIGQITTPPARLEDIQVSGLTLDGNMDEQDMECWGGPCDSGGTTFIRNNGITIRRVSHARVRHVTIRHARSGGLAAEKDTTSLFVDGLISEENFFDGLSGCETTNSNFSHLILRKNHYAGLSTDLYFSKNVFRDVQILDNRDVGIFMRASALNRFESVTVQRSGSFGIFLANSGSRPTCARDNEFHDLTVLDSRREAFRLNDSCPGNSISGTTLFKNNPGACVSERMGLSDVSVLGHFRCTFGNF